MKRQSIISLAAVAGCVLLSACGDDVTKVTNVTNEVSGMEVVSSADSLGKCDSSTLGKTAYASDENVAYVCADSGWVPLSQKASDGKNGTYCSAETLSDSSGYRIVCGGDSVGVIVNGENGSDGKTGEKGDAGENGSACTAEPLSDGKGYKVVCDGDSVGVIANGVDENGCSLADNDDGTSTLICDANTVTLYKALCGKTFFDPTKKFCAEEMVYDLCGGKSYDIATEFCNEETVYELCNGEVYDPSTEFCDFRDATLYGYAVIGTQTWMTNNLNFEYNEGTAKSYCYENDPENCKTYGRLYTWDAATKSCPEGFHLPSEEEWKTLEAYVADSLFDGSTESVGYALKSTSGWKTDNGLNAFGFNALPAGYYSNMENTFSKVRDNAYFWSTKEFSSENFAYYWGMENYSNSLKTTTYSKEFSLSVRCVRD